MPLRPLTALLCALVAGCSTPSGTPTGEGPAPRQLVARIVQRYPHATDAFTQGLVFHEGSLYESTGQVGRGSLRRLSLEQAEPVWRQSVPDVFPEGLASDGSRLFQLTWRNGQLYTWAGSPPSRQGTLTYAGEGWGLCHRKGQLVRSDGSAVLRFHDPVRFTEQSWMRVTLQGQPVDWLNELECTDDAIYANVWVSTPLMKNSTIVQINPETGEVEALIDASALVREVDVASKEPDAVLNGIAIEPGSQRIFLTGKYWPTLFEVVFEPAPTSSP